MYFILGSFCSRRLYTIFIKKNKAVQCLVHLCFTPLPFLMPLLTLLEFSLLVFVPLNQVRVNKSPHGSSCSLLPSFAWCRAVLRLSQLPSPEITCMSLCLNTDSRKNCSHSSTKPCSSSLTLDAEYLTHLLKTLLLTCFPSSNPM